MTASHLTASPHTRFPSIKLLKLPFTSKAGRVVGQKGAMIQSLKVKSGAMQIRMQKDPKVIIELRT